MHSLISGIKSSSSIYLSPGSSSNQVVIGLTDVFVQDHKVGINTSTLTETLNVDGNIKTNGYVDINGPRIYSGSGNPGFTAPKGSLYLKTNAAGSSDRLWVNSDGSTGWASFTASA